jgi:cytochrome c-type biogenesis protein CcmH
MLLLPSLATAYEAQPLAANPQAEARLKALAVELRCLVCQNQTLADSNAPLAEDLRREVREMIAKDMSDKEIIDFLVTVTETLSYTGCPGNSQLLALAGAVFWELAQRAWCMRCAGDEKVIDGIVGS